MFSSWWIIFETLISMTSWQSPGLSSVWEAGSLRPNRNGTFPGRMRFWIIFGNLILIGGRWNWNRFFCIVFCFLLPSAALMVGSWSLSGEDILGRYWRTASDGCARKFILLYSNGQSGAVKIRCCRHAKQSSRMKMTSEMVCYPNRNCGCEQFGGRNEVVRNWPRPRNSVAERSNFEEWIV